VNDTNADVTTTQAVVPTQVATPTLKLSIGEKTLRAVGKVWTAISADMRLRALLGGGITAGFAFLGMHVEGETALSMIAAGMLLAGIGPHSKTGNE
jgi:hypothetical protein